MTYFANGAWAAQQLREATPHFAGSRYLIRDNSYKFGKQSAAVAEGTEIGVMKIPPRSPDLNPMCECFLGSIQRECLDHVIVIIERHPKRILTSYFVRHYGGRVHRFLYTDSPDPRPVQPPELAEVVEFCNVGVRMARAVVILRAPAFCYYIIISPIPLGALRKVGGVNIPWVVAFLVMLGLGFYYLSQRKLPEKLKASLLAPMQLLSGFGLIAATSSPDGSAAQSGTVLTMAAMVFGVLGIAGIDERGFRRTPSSLLIASYCICYISLLAFPLTFSDEHHKYMLFALPLSDVIYYTACRISASVPEPIRREPIHA